MRIEACGAGGFSRAVRRWAQGARRLAAAAVMLAFLMPGTGETAFAGPEDVRPETSAEGSPEAPALLAEPAAPGSSSDAAAEPWTAEAACPRGERSPRDYHRCLYEATHTSAKAMEVALADALTVIDQRADLASVQRAAWKNLLEEAQSRFLIYRNFDCQSVAPFEGPRGIGNFEQRALCLIKANRARAGALSRRYGKPRLPPGAIDGPKPRPGIWTHPTPPPAD